MFAALAIMAVAAHAAPYIPASGTEILERLPSRNDPTQRELQRLRAALVANPGNLRVAVALSQRYIDIWRDGGDPRYLGYAQAALASWWKLPHPPLDAQVMRATLLQSTHQFPAALADLNAVLQEDHENAQAWLTRATILQVLGDYSQARQSCEQLVRRAPVLIMVTCLAGIEGVNGHAADGYRQLTDALTADPQASVSIQIWSLTILAEMAVRRGDFRAAQSHFQNALSIGVPDNYLLATYADFLLDQHAPDQVITLLKGKTQIDTLLLRYALALKDAGSGDAATYREMLAQRFDAAKMRGDATHQREQARFELELMNNPAAALVLAQRNWSVQKEPADTLLLLKAAVAANDRNAARPVLEWLQKTHLEDRHLPALLAKLGMAS